MARQFLYAKKTFLLRADLILSIIFQIFRQHLIDCLFLFFAQRQEGASGKSGVDSHRGQNIFDRGE